jgi:hypothetical protein
MLARAGRYSVQRSIHSWPLGQSRWEWSPRTAPQSRSKWTGLQRDTLELVKAQRYLELRWGEALGPNLRGKPGHGNATAVALSRDERRWFRLLAFQIPRSAVFDSGLAAGKVAVETAHYIWGFAAESGRPHHQP